MALSYATLEGLWILAGGPASAASIAAAITYPESGANPNSIQAGQPYATTGWGLWQITPGNSVPSVATDRGLLQPFANARAAVAKYKGAGNTFRPWTTYTSGKYLAYVQNGVTPDLVGAGSYAAGQQYTDTGSSPGATLASNPVSSTADNIMSSVYVAIDVIGNEITFAMTAILGALLMAAGIYMLFKETGAGNGAGAAVAALRAVNPVRRVVK